MENTTVRRIALALVVALGGSAFAGEGTAGLFPDGSWSLAGAYAPEPSASASEATLSLPALSRAAPGGPIFSERPGYLEAKAGPLFFIEDLAGMSPGFEIDGAFGFHPVSILALEASSGYFWGEDEGDGGSPDEKLWGIPLEARAIVEIPFILSPYVGAGAGYYYIVTDVSGAGDESDFVFGWNAVAGLRLELGPLILGVEGKYIYTDVADMAWGSDRLQGAAVMGTLGMAF